MFLAMGLEFNEERTASAFREKLKLESKGILRRSREKDHSFCKGVCLSPTGVLGLSQWMQECWSCLSGTWENRALLAVLLSSLQSQALSLSCLPSGLSFLFANLAGFL